VPHQANLRIVEAVAKRLRSKGARADLRVADDIVHSGNTSSASIPLALDHMRAQGRLQSGETVLLVGFGAGLSYAAQVVVWTYVAGALFFLLSLAVSLIRPERPTDLVRPRVPFGQEPLPASVAMQPPFDLPAVDVLSEEQVPGQVPVGCAGSGPAGAFAAVGELERLPRPAVGTVDEEGHGRALASLGTHTRQVTRSRTASSALR